MTAHLLPAFLKCFKSEFVCVRIEAAMVRINDYLIYQKSNYFLEMSLVYCNFQNFVYIFFLVAPRDRTTLYNYYQRNLGPGRQRRPGVLSVPI